MRRRGKNNPQGTTSVIVAFVQGGQVPAALKKYMRGQKLDIINGQVLDLPNGLIKQLEASPDVFRVHHNRPIGKENYRTSVSVGAKSVQESWATPAPASASRSSTRASPPGTTT